jgi:hypothetical protein
LLRGNIALVLQGNIDGYSSAPFGQQQIASSPDRDLRYLRKSLQQPGQRDFEPDMIVRHIEMA